MSTTIGGVPIVGMPDLGAVTDNSSFVGEHAGSGRFAAPAFAGYLANAILPFTVPQGCVGDGVHDDTFAIQAALDAVGAAGGGIVWLRRGTYRLSTTLTMNYSGVTLCGSGRGATILATSSPTADVIQIGNGTNNPGYCTVASLRMMPSVTRTAGAGINVRNAHDVRITDFDIWNDFIGVILDGGAQMFECTLDNFEIDQPVSDGIRVGPTALAQDVWIERGVISTTGGNGIVFSNLSGGHFGRVDLISCKGQAAVNIAPGAGQVVTALFCYDVEADTPTTGYSWLFGGSGNISNIMLTGCWAASANLAGMEFLNSNTSGVTLTGCIVQNNKQHGIVLTMGTEITVANCQVFCNSQQAANTYSGIAVANGVAGFHVLGCFIGNGGSISFLVPNQQQWGINIGTGCAGYVIKDNIISANVTGSITDASKTGIVQDNIGYQTRATGQAQVLAAATTVVVTHGLAGTPKPGNISLTPATDWGSVHHWWVTSITATTFTIAVDVAPTSGALFFDWSASLATP